MAQAGRLALARACARKELSFASVDTIADRWALFCRFAKEEGIGRMERMTPDVLRRYGCGLADQVSEGAMSPSYAQNLVSAVNTVMALVRPWQKVSPTMDCGIADRSNVREIPPSGIDRTHLASAITVLHKAGFHRGAAVAELARELGLRSKEASLLNTVTAVKDAQNRGTVDVFDGTKGGRRRTVPAGSPGQIDALRRAAALQGDGRSLIPAHLTWKQWREGELRLVREMLQEYGIQRLHDLRAAYACQRYEELTGHRAPVFDGRRCDREEDMTARKIISRELGHGVKRIDVVAAYIGGR